MFGILASTIALAIGHSIAPDHWLPFCTIAKARNWSIKKLIFIALLGGVGHVLSSFILGLAGIAAGFAVKELVEAESHRGEIAGWLLVGFGLLYAIWSLRHIRKKHVDHLAKRDVTPWVLIAVIVFGPCEPLIPLMFMAFQFGWHTVFLVSLAFGIFTVMMVVGLSVVSYLGVHIFLKRVGKLGDVIAGLIIAITGLTVMFLGI
jgi:hypothetical protein